MIIVKEIVALTWMPVGAVMNKLLPNFRPCTFQLTDIKFPRYRRLAFVSCDCIY